MKILLSAYACEPNKGSEPGVGWSWAVELAKQHEIWVLTRDNNEPTIINYLEKNPEYKNNNLHFIFVGLPRVLTFYKRGNRGIRLYYMFWQRKATKVADALNREIHFDLVQHVTFVSYTQSTYMYKLGIPLIWGPVSGGENIPSEIKIEMTFKERLIEAVRKFSQTTALVTPSIRRTMKSAKAILVATEETKNKIPEKYQGKTYVIPAIGLEKIPDVQRIEGNGGKVKIVMAGRLIYWKAFDIGLKAFLQIVNKYPNAELHILGEGNQKPALQKLAEAHLNKQVFFDPPVQHDKIFEYYSQFDLFVNTTLRDSGCMTMMEAMSVGLPCIAIATGGPGILLDADSLGRIEVASYEECVTSLSDRLEFLINSGDVRNKLAKAQNEYLIDIFLLSRKTDRIGKIYR
ncbi:MAG: glycosyltransferase family 4 protein [Lachnospiraceae bacterium]|nr:glycosyltransferase family 4 protein [Lachnospiraceae bacterium]